MDIIYFLIVLKPTISINLLGTAGIYTIVDFHQDLGHRQWCGEGVGGGGEREILEWRREHFGFRWERNDCTGKEVMNETREGVDTMISESNQ